MCNLHTRHEIALSICSRICITHMQMTLIRNAVNMYQKTPHSMHVLDAFQAICAVHRQAVRWAGLPRAWSGGRYAVCSVRWAVGGGRWAVGGGQCAVGGGQGSLGSRLVSMTLKVSG